MKKYLFGLGAMLVGAGLMFVLMHGEVSADSKPEVPEKFVCSDYADKMFEGNFEERGLAVWHCRVGNVTCGVFAQGGISCLKTKSGLFK